MTAAKVAKDGPVCYNEGEAKLPRWAIKLCRRLAALGHGQYLVLFTAGPRPSWTVKWLGMPESEDSDTEG